MRNIESCSDRGVANLIEQHVPRSRPRAVLASSTGRQQLSCEVEQPIWYHEWKPSVSCRGGQEHTVDTARADATAAVEDACAFRFSGQGGARAMIIGKASR